MPRAGLDADLTSCSGAGEHERRAEDRDARRTAARRRREDPHANVPVGRGRIDEDRLAEVHLAREPLQHLLGDLARVGEDGELVPGERDVGEDVRDDVTEARHGSNSRRAGAAQPQALILACDATLIVRHAEAAPGQAGRASNADAAAVASRRVRSEAACASSGSSPMRSCRARCCAPARRASAARPRCAGGRRAARARGDRRRRARRGARPRRDSRSSIGHQPDCGRAVAALDGRRRARVPTVRARRSSSWSSFDAQSPSAACASRTATSRRFAASTSRSSRARCSACSARTAPARRRPSRSSRATASATPARSAVLGHDPQQPGPRVPGAHRRRAPAVGALAEPHGARDALVFAGYYERPRDVDEVIELVGLIGEARRAREDALRRPEAPARPRRRARRRSRPRLPRRADHGLRPGRAARSLGDDPLATRSSARPCC